MVSTWNWGISMDGGSTTSSGSRLQCSATLRAKKHFSSVSVEFAVSQCVPIALPLGTAEKSLASTSPFPHHVFIHRDRSPEPSLSSAPALVKTELSGRAEMGLHLRQPLTPAVSSSGSPASSAAQSHGSWHHGIVCFVLKTQAFCEQRTNGA